MDAQQLTRELVAFESPSHVSNREISQFVEDRLRALHFDIELVEYTDEQGVAKVNVVGRRGSEGDGRGLAYFCHSDVPFSRSQSYYLVAGAGLEPATSRL